MATDDVRIRLSAEGVAEVVAALQKIQAQAAATSKSTVSGFNGVNAALTTVRRTLAALGVAISIGTFTAITKGAADAAESTLNLAQALGATVQHTRELARAAKLAGTDVTQVAGSIGQFAAKTADALAGDPRATALFRDQLRLTREELEQFKGLDTAGRLEIVARAFTKLADGPAKTALGIDLFGKKFKELIPIVNEIGANGLPKVAIQMKEDTLRAAAALGDEFDDLKTTVTELSIQFVGGLAPAVTTAMRSIRGDLADNAGVWESWGNSIGKVVAGVLLSIANVTDSIGGAIEIAKIDAKALADIAQAIASRNFALVAAIREQAKVEEAAVEEAQKKRAEERFKAFQSIGQKFQGPTAPPGLEAGGTPGEPSDALERAAELRRAQIDRDLKLVQAGLKLREAEEQRSFDRGLTSVQEFYDRRREIVAGSINAEIVALQKRRVVAEQDPGLKNRAAELVKLDSQIEQLVVGRASQIEELNAREADEYKRLASERLDLDQKIFEARGDHHAAELIRIQQEIDKSDQLLVAQNASSEEAERTLGALRSSLNAQAEFNALSLEANQALSGFDRDRARIQNQVDAGLLSQAVGEAKILGLEKERVDGLKEIGNAMLRVAQDSQDPERIARAEDFLVSVEQLELSLRRVTDVAAGLKATVIDSLGASFVHQFGEAEVAALSFGGVLKNMLLDVAAAMRRFLTQLIFTRAIMALFPGARIGSPGSTAQASDVFIAAEGGLVSGPGTGTSDSVPARLSTGEYIVRAAAVAQPGVLRALDALNHGGVHIVTPRLSHRTNFASGGLVSGGSGGGRLDASLRLGLSRGLVVEEMSSPEGLRVLLEHVEENPRAFDAARGGR